MLPIDSPQLPGRVMIIDEDGSVGHGLEQTLRKYSYEVTLAKGTRDAKACILEKEAERYDCIFIVSSKDQRIWLEQTEWISKCAPWLARVLISDACDKEILLKALRSGISDVLELPADDGALVRCVENAIASSRYRRGLVRISMEARMATRLHRRSFPGAVTLSEGFARDYKLDTDALFIPALEAGGDIFVTRELAGDRLLLLAADVSGHDISAGFISTLFLGFCLGMIHKGAEPEEFCELFHRFLVCEWNKRKQRDELLTSVGVCAVVLDFAKKQLHCICNGFPLPVLVDAYLKKTHLGSGTAPLGWFDAPLAKRVSCPLPEAASLVLYSDGLDEVRKRRSICALYVADTLLEQNRGREEPLHVAGQSDDIMVMRTNWALKGSSKPCPARTFLCMQIAGDSAPKIDEIQAKVSQALDAKILFANEADRDAGKAVILLCSREALLNSLVHGCRNRSDRTCTLHMAQMAGGIVRVRIDDDGEAFPAQEDHVEYGHIPFGLRIIRGFADSCERIPGENAFIMDFSIRGIAKSD
ncbi:MAG: SpoIIE family protein phosphatase [Opitutales bacterium]|nr:SpoIIE family protein phosphatase [Opitutales bacterium]